MISTQQPTPTSLPLLLIVITNPSPDLPIITTPHAKSHLASAANKDPSETFTQVHDLDFFDECLVRIAGKEAAIKVTGMPGKHVPPGPGGVAGKVNDLLGAVSFDSVSFVFDSFRLWCIHLLAMMARKHRVGEG